MNDLIEMTYNPAYYIDYYKRFGFKKAKDLYAYYIKAKEPPDIPVKVIEKIKKRNDISLRYLYYQTWINSLKKGYKEAEMS